MKKERGKIVVWLIVVSGLFLLIFGGSIVYNFSMMNEMSTINLDNEPLSTHTETEYLEEAQTIVKTMYDKANALYSLNDRYVFQLDTIPVIRELNGPVREEILNYKEAVSLVFTENMQKEFEKTLFGEMLLIYRDNDRYYRLAPFSSEIVRRGDLFQIDFLNENMIVSTIKYVEVSSSGESEPKFTRMVLRKNVTNWLIDEYYFF